MLQYTCLCARRHRCRPRASEEVGVPITRVTAPCACGWVRSRVRCLSRRARYRALSPQASQPERASVDLSHDDTVECQGVQESSGPARAAPARGAECLIQILTQMCRGPEVIHRRYVRGGTPSHWSGRAARRAPAARPRCSPRAAPGPSLGPSARGAARGRGGAPSRAMLAARPTPYQADEEAV